ncbi:hypothetical protein JZ751_023699 [Albula glossodonta]|uniref:Thromboxane A2 receptor n=1 Tax=Albula glossodonta TaxID=121402 RepID=A0A8T2MRA2_9TELE|nr:hypothetical protein JZ751_023699 [Albula glossodonta]
MCWSEQPDMVSVSVPGSVPGSVPCSVPGSLPGSVPGSVPVSVPEAVRVIFPPLSWWEICRRRAVPGRDGLRSNLSATMALYEPTSSSPLFLSFFPSSSSPSLPVLNGSSPPPKPPPLGMTCLTMTLGSLSNLAALAVLARSSARFRRRAKAPFLLLTGALLLTDLAGHLIPGALALHLARGGQGWAGKGTWLCQVFGACMVFFGLCPLLLGGAMAVERCLGITRPLLHAAVVTAGHARRAVALLASLAMLLALLPLVAVGSYTPQFPGTWCFLPVHMPPSAADAGLVLAFSGLGLAALALSLLCNSLSGLALLQARLGPSGAQPGRGPWVGCGHHGDRARLPLPSPPRALDVEMMGQLAGITLVSCVCWTPFLVREGGRERGTREGEEEGMGWRERQGWERGVCERGRVFISVSVGRFYSGSDRAAGARPYERQVLLGLRLASWNQILDPWVYILLRRAVLRRVFRLLQPQRSSFTHTHSSSCADSNRTDTCLRRHTQSQH